MNGDKEQEVIRFPTFDPKPSYDFREFQPLRDVPGDPAHIAAPIGIGTTSPMFTGLPPGGYASGKDGTPDEITVEGIKTALQMLTTFDTKSQADIAQKHIPNSTIHQSPDGYTYLTMPGGENVYINKPGMSGRDWVDIAAIFVKYHPAARISNFLKAAGAGWLKRFGAGGAATGATSVAEDIAAGVAGSEQGILPGKTALSVAAGGAAEVLGPFLGWAGSKISGSTMGQRVKSLIQHMRREKLIDDDGLTASGEALADTLGIDTKDISTRLRAEIEQFAKGSVEPGSEVGSLASAEFRVPLTKGEAMDMADPARVTQLALEENIAKADVTTEAGALFRSLTEEQATTMLGVEGRTGAGVVQEVIGGGKPILVGGGGGPVKTELGERIGAGGSQIQASVTQTARQLKAQADAAYTEVAGTTASLQHNSARKMLESVVSKIRNDDAFELGRGTLDPTPRSADIVAGLERLIKGLQGTKVVGKAKGKGKEIPPFSPGFDHLQPVHIRSIDSLRRKISSRIADAARSHPNDERILVAAKQHLDKWVDDAVDRALFTGDEAAIKMLKSARSLWTRYRTEFTGTKGADKIIAKLTGKEGELGSQEAVELIFGAGQLGGKGTTAAVLGKLKGIYGESSQEWQILKEMTWLRILQRSITGDKFSAVKFKNELDNAMGTRGMDVMNVMFPKGSDSRKVMMEFRALAARLVPPASVGNPSKSNVNMWQMLQQFLPRLGIALDLSMGGTPGGSIVSAMVARHAQSLAKPKAQTRAAREIVSGPVVTQKPPLDRPTIIIPSVEATQEELTMPEFMR